LEAKVIQNWDPLGRGEFGSPQVEIVIQMMIFLNAERWGRKPLPVRKWTGQSGPVGIVYFRRLNTMTEYDPYLVPLVREVLAGMGGLTIFNTLETSQSYHNPASYGIHFEIGTFQFRRMPLGLQNAGGAYCRLVAKLVRSLGNPGGIVAYMDNILLHSKNVNTLLDLMEMKIFEVHFQAGIVMTDKKTRLHFWGCNKVAFLGFKVNKKGLIMTDKALTRIANGPTH